MTELAPVDTSRVSQIQAGIKLNDAAAITRFGEDSQKKVAGYADQILQQARGGDMGDTGKLLSDLVIKAKGLDIEDLSKKGFMDRLLGDARRHVERFRNRFETVSSQIDTISADLARRVAEMRTDLTMLDGLYDQARASIQDLDAYIAAGKAHVEAFRQRELPGLQAALAEAADDPTEAMLRAQAYQEAVQGVDRLEKRVSTLLQARQIAIQQLPQIRIVQNGDATLVESLGASINLTIPAWKQKMTLLLGLQRQQDALRLQQTVTDTTNALLRQTSEMMKTQAIAIEEQSQKGVVDVETLAKTNQDLIDTLQGVMQLQVEGRGRRAAAEQAMSRHTEDLRRALAATAAQRVAA